MIASRYYGFLKNIISSVYLSIQPSLTDLSNQEAQVLLPILKMVMLPMIGYVNYADLLYELHINCLHHKTYYGRLCVI